jgi:arylsulfatase A-like enzyme
VAQWPGVIKPGSVSEVLVSGEDLVPTFLEAAGIIPDKEITGQSFLPAFKGQSLQERKYLYAVRGSHGSALADRSTSGFDMSRAIFNKDYKLIYNPLFYLYYSPTDCGGSPFWKDLIERNKKGLLDPKFSGTIMFTSERPVFELFDLQNDPDEFVNLAGKEEFKEIEYQLKKEMQKWMIRYRDVVPLPILPGK